MKLLEKVSAKVFEYIQDETKIANAFCIALIIGVIVGLLVSQTQLRAAAEYLPEIEIIVVDDDTGEPVDITDILPEFPEEWTLPEDIDDWIDRFELPQNNDEPYELLDTVILMDMHEELQTQNEILATALGFIAGILLGVAALSKWNMGV
jgi:hypothetical protein